jgi:general secretion pathway protein D
VNKLTWPLIAILAGCASPTREAQTLIAHGQADAGLRKLEALAKENPQDIETKAALALARTDLANQAVNRGDSLRRAGQNDSALAAYREALRIFPDSARAKAGIEAAEGAKRQETQLSEAKRMIAERKPLAARDTLRAILAQAPELDEARMLMAMLDAELASSMTAPQLGSIYQKPVSLEFQNAQLTQVLNVLSRQTGLNFILDKDTRMDSKITIFARQVPAAEAINLILSTQALDKKVLNENSLLIYPRLPNKIKDYEELSVRSFYIANADVKGVATLLRSVLKVRDIYTDDKLNLLIVRDTPQVMQLVEKIIATQDLAEPEVMLEVEVMEIKRSKLTELGILYPSAVTAGIIPSASGTDPVTTARDLSGLSGRDISISGISATLNLLKTDGDVKLLANPRIRVKNREKAKIHIGDRVPVITSTLLTSSGPGSVSESVSYLDVGLKLDVEPNVYLEDEVGIKVGLEVSNIVKEVKSAAGSLTYQIGTRSAATSLRLKNGETQMLAGLISDEDRSTSNKIPGLGDLPILGRLFSSQRDDRTQTEIVLLITPRIVRNLPRLPLQSTEFLTGTDSSVGAPPLRLSPANSLSSRRAPLSATPQLPASVPAMPALQVPVTPADTAPEPAAEPTQILPANEPAGETPVPQDVLQQQP